MQTQAVQTAEGCGDTRGTLPACAPLANPYVPFQQGGSKQYQTPKALVRRTIFPGLDLPFMGMVNKTQEVTPLTEMMALCFVAHELALYLDTHQDDAEAFAMYQSFLALKKEARERYAWLDDPWPWDYDRQREG